jgi:MFS family permease
VTVSVNFLSLRIVQLGGTPGDIALSSAVASLAEIPAALVAGRIAARVGLRGLFIGSTLLYAAALGSWVVIDSVGLIIATRALTGVAFAGLFVAIVLTIQSTLPNRLQGSGQSLFQAVAFGATAVVANIVGWFVFEAIGPGVLFALSAVLAAFRGSRLGRLAGSRGEPVPLPPAHG